MKKHSFRRLFVKVEGGVVEDLFMVYDVDPEDDLAPQIQKILEDANTLDSKYGLHGYHVDEHDPAYVGVVTVTEQENRDGKSVRAYLDGLEKMKMCSDLDELINAMNTFYKEMSPQAQEFVNAKKSH